ncbi:MAG: hypothetical protein ABH813_01985 [Patescibacteria group bacterium]
MGWLVDNSNSTFYPLYKNLGKQKALSVDKQNPALYATRLSYNLKGRGCLAIRAAFKEGEPRPLGRE